MAQPSAPPSYGDVVKEKDMYAGNPAPQGYSSYPYPNTTAPPTAYSTSDQGIANPNYSYPQPTIAYNQPVGNAPTSAEPLAADTSSHVGFTVSGSFDDKDVRRLFIRKVFITLGLQLAVTFGFVCIFQFVPGVDTFVQANPGMYWAGYGIFIFTYITLVCCGEVRRKHPHNIIFLVMLTLALSYMVGTIASYYTAQSVIIGIGVTVAVCAGIIIFSMQTKFDFTKCGGLIFVLLWVLIIFGFVTIFTYYRPWYLQVVYGALGALVFSLFLAFDTQLIMGGKRYELSPEEYIYGALNLYIDIIYIFLFLLAIFGSGKS